MSYFKLLNQEIIVIFVLIAITFLSYINILQNSFAYDDEDFFVNWETIRDIHNIPQLLTGELPANHQGVYRPLRSIFYVLSYRIWGNNPAGYHFQSILIHLAIVLIIYKILRLITKNKFIAFGSSAVFATHPIHTEAITYATASMDTIGIVFFFISFYFYLKSQILNINQNRYLLFAIMSAILAFFTYEMTLTLPFIMLGYSFVFNKINKKNIVNRIKYILPFFLLAATYTFIRIFIVQIGDRAHYLGDNFLIVSRQARIENIEIILRYIYLLIFPNNLTIIQEFPKNILNTILEFLYYINKEGQLVNFLARTDFLIPIIMAAFFISTSIFFFRKSQVILFSLLWFVISLLPIMSIIPQGTVIAERYLYIPSFGFSLLFTYIFYTGYNYAKKRSLYKLSIGIIVCFVLINSLYMIKTIYRNLDWKDPISLWTSAVKANTDNSLTYGALGGAYYRAGNDKQAIVALNKSIEYEESNEIVYFYLGRIYENQKDLHKAIELYEKSIKINPRYPSPYNRLGVIYSQQNDLDKAIEMQQKAVNYAPKVIEFNYNLAVNFEKKSEFKQALQYYKKALDLNPNHIQTLNNSAIILSKLNENELAINLLKRAIENNPGAALSYFNLGALYEKTGDSYKAIEYYKRGISLDSSNEVVKDRLKKILK